MSNWGAEACGALIQINVNAHGSGQIHRIEITRDMRFMTFPELFDQFSMAILPLGSSDASHLRFQAVARYASARTGDAPFTGNGLDQIVFVASGSTKLVAQVSHGREQIVAFHFANDLVLVPASAAHTYTLCALEDCELIYFPSAEFFKLARHEAGMIDEVLARSMRALARCREKAVALGRKNAQERLAGFLISMAERIGTPTPEGYELNLPMSRRDIADSLGLTIETVSRQLGELREGGFVETSGRSKVVLHDLPGLNRVAGHLATAA